MKRPLNDLKITRWRWKRNTNLRTNRNTKDISFVFSYHNHVLVLTSKVACNVFVIVTYFEFVFSCLFCFDFVLFIIFNFWSSCVPTGTAASITTIIITRDRCRPIRQCYMPWGKSNYKYLSLKLLTQKPLFVIKLTKIDRVVNTYQ